MHVFTNEKTQRSSLIRRKSIEIILKLRSVNRIKKSEESRLTRESNESNIYCLDDILKIRRGHSKLRKYLLLHNNKLFLVTGTIEHILRTSRLIYINLVTIYLHSLTLKVSVSLHSTLNVLATPSRQTIIMRFI